MNCADAEEAVQYVVETCENGSLTKGFFVRVRGQGYPRRSVPIRGENGVDKTNAARGPATPEPHRS